MLNEGQNVEIRAKKYFLMEHTRECVEIINGIKGDMSKINAVRNHKGVFLMHESLGTSGANLKKCGRNNLEVSSVSSLPIENAKRSSDSKGHRINKSSFKTWHKFMQ